MASDEAPPGRTPGTLQARILRILACPVDHSRLQEVGARGIQCEQGHTFPIVAGIPILFRPGLGPTHPYFEKTRALIAQEEGLQEPSHWAPTSGQGVDPFVQAEILKTHGYLYKNLIGRLTRYPIPEIGIPGSEGAVLLDVGCNWGRWTLAAARKGYTAIGLDPSLEACLAGRRVADQLGIDAAFVVGDARALPFSDRMLDRVFSYSVLQHFDKNDAKASLDEIGRVLKSEGESLVQMPNLLGIRQAYNRLRQVLKRESGQFRVRYWMPGELRSTFHSSIGPSALEVDGFFSLNPQSTDLDLLSPFHRTIVRLSGILRSASDIIPPLGLFADSLYVRSAPASKPLQPESGSQGHP